MTNKQPERSVEGIEEIVNRWLKFEKEDNYVSTDVGLDQVCLDGYFDLNELIDSFHQELQKARQDWLREEIVKLKEAKLWEYNFQGKRSMAFKNYNQALDSVINRYKQELDN